MSMRIVKTVLAATAAIGFALTASLAFAQQQAPATERKPEDNWLKICEELESGELACIMRQLVVTAGQFTGSFVIRNNPHDENRLTAIAAVPLGVLLPVPLTWQIDGERPVRVPYVVCDPRSCISQLVINEAYISSLKKGAVLKLIAKNRQNKDLVVEINLAGFTAVYDGDNYRTFEQFRADSSGQTALENLLQQRADDLRDGSAPQ
jgi:invasion protein IalB